MGNISFQFSDEAFLELALDSLQELDASLALDKRDPLILQCTFQDEAFVPLLEMALCLGGEIVHSRDEQADTLSDAEAYNLAYRIEPYLNHLYNQQRKVETDNLRVSQEISANAFEQWKKQYFNNQSKDKKRFYPYPSDYTVVDPFSGTGYIDYASDESEKESTQER